ncbi:SDR family oxidoreductase [Pseudohoeflea suaedae]|uniref:SDR family oxidoreductase n=2 Tax=Pseudohoeflea suaedae TaxID=877384 RepID=A0A4V3A701_9HYPH|nr:SDR family oxidoreductase [Pseudohoeflea suaedae]
MTPLGNARTLAGKTVLYTGAAGGLGLATSLQLIEAGARVVAIDNDPAKCEELRKAVPQADAARLMQRDFDLSDTDALPAKLEALAAETGGFDVVINNAAMYPARAFEDYSIEEYRKIQRVNVESHLMCVRAALPGMKERGWGRIVNIASITFYGGWQHLAPYVQSKGALVGLTRAWAREFGKYGVTVNAISPGAFPTDAEKIHADPEGYNRYVLENQSVQRRGHAGDIAGTILFLTSENASFITGQTINVDGGWVMQ